MQIIDNIKEEQIEDLQDLYRHFDKNDNLLYVGISASAIKRLIDHKSQSSWFNKTTKVTIEKFENRGAVIEAENKAILSEHPIYNKTLQNLGKTEEPPEINDKKWHKTPYVGIRYRLHKKRRFQGHPDKYYIMRYRKKGKLQNEAVGWRSGNVTAQYASLLRSEIVQNIREGKRPQSLREMRKMRDEQYEKEHE